MSVLPVIDADRIAAGGAALRMVGQEIGQACRETGFFYVRGGAVPARARQDVFAAAHRFFAAAPAVKEAVSIRRSPHNRGYVGFGAEALDPARGPDRKEAFNVGLELAADDPEVLAGLPFRGVNLWPDVPGFRDALLDYYGAALDLGRSLHRAIAVELGLSAHHFDPLLDRPLATLRLLHYPAAAGDGADRLGAGAHTDYGNITLLLTDEAGGLEVKRRDGTWMPVPVLPDALVCNIGDCLMRWTNDLFTSTPHRVVNPTGRERYSVAFFLDANPDALVSCLPTCQGPDRPPRYPAVTAADYLRQRLDATYGVAPGT